MTSRRLIKVSILLALIVGIVAPAPPASAAPRISLSPREGPAGTRVRVDGAGFAPRTRITILFDDLALAKAQSNLRGQFSVQLLTPWATPGRHYVTARQSRPAASARAAFDVLPTPATNDWLQFAHDPQASGFNPLESTLGPENAGALHILRSAPVGGGSTPAVSDGVVYYTDATRGTVGALRQSDLSELWVTTLDEVPTGRVAVEAGRVLAAGWTASGGTLYALDAETGRIIWRALQGVTIDHRFAPRLVNGVVYGAFGDEGRVYALLAATGKELWSSAPAVTSVDGEVAVNDGLVYASGHPGTVALDASNGAVVWTASTAITFAASTDGDRVFTWSYPASGSQRRLFALDATSGTILWTFSPAPEEPAAHPPAVANGFVYSVSQAASANCPGAGCIDTVRAFRADTGAVVWQTTFAGLTFLAGRSMFAVANGLLYIGGRTGGLYVLDASTGGVLRVMPVDSADSPRPIVANGMVIFTGVDIYEIGV
jgi:outer membrane protein assembly factor BamB